MSTERDMASELARNYLAQRNIPQLFESLVTGLVFHRPEDPITFLQSCLEEVRGREGGYSWNCFITTAGGDNTSRNLFSRTKPLPPISTGSGETASGKAATSEAAAEARAGASHKQQPVSSSAVVATATTEQCITSLENKPLLFVLGGPGCGKGTQCEKLVEEFGLTHLSSGDLLREEVARGSLQGHSIQQLMREGKLVPPEVTIGLLKSAILSKPEAVGFLIDGFPRELTQAHMFEKQVCECSVVVVFECSEEVLLGRLRKRGESSGRVDDNDITIRKRLATFTNSTLPVVQHYQLSGKVRMVDAARTVDKVYCELRQVFQKLLADK